LTASNYIVQVEDRCYQANRTSLELLQTVKNLECEVLELKVTILDLK